MSYPTMYIYLRRVAIQCVKFCETSTRQRFSGNLDSSGSPPEIGRLGTDRLKFSRKKIIRTLQLLASPTKRIGKLTGLNFCEPSTQPNVARNLNLFGNPQNHGSFCRGVLFLCITPQNFFV